MANCVRDDDIVAWAERMTTRTRMMKRRHGTSASSPHPITPELADGVHRKSKVEEVVNDDVTFLSIGQIETPTRVARIHKIRELKPRKKF